jgi:hypothetical protein
MAIREVFHRLIITGIFDVVIVKNLGIPAQTYQVSHIVPISKLDGLEREPRGETQLFLQDSACSRWYC